MINDPAILARGGVFEILNASTRNTDLTPITAFPNHPITNVAGKIRVDEFEMNNERMQSSLYLAQIFLVASLSTCGRNMIACVSYELDLEGRTFLVIARASLELYFIR